MSSPTEYLTPENAGPIHVDLLEDAHDANWFHGQGQWAELCDPQIEQLVEHLRGVHRLKRSGQLQPNIAGRDTFAANGWERTADCIVAVLR